ncbi:hypothetical protein [Stenotrophomonas phage vB_SmaS_BUCT548]|uniref:Uncharacterized protein n=1 Tax=Stenotrophomonas phage vB_SmaS_BUCT548 TaxID=2712941 RepID=A0A7D2HGR3_9CAUD|nr:hypothetical protein PQD75_gp059 [Stenotrophomonas phage vB_SmaS_BUCT548]QIQ60813.1 hypothetical protein [Stenotrophomonas phage vB_SmaS_BUCT548]
MNTNLATQVENYAQAAVLLDQGQATHTASDVLCTGLDADAKHFYCESTMGKGRYVGTRFSDGSAVSASGHTGALVEYIGVFAAEWEPEPEVTKPAPHGWDEVQA